MSDPLNPWDGLRLDEVLARVRSVPVGQLEVELQLMSDRLVEESGGRDLYADGAIGFALAVRILKEIQAVRRVAELPPVQPQSHWGGAL